MLSYSGSAFLLSVLATTSRMADLRHLAEGAELVPQRAGSVHSFEVLRGRCSLKE